MLAQPKKSDLPQSLLETAPDAYSAVAAEYYDAQRHPTCANFRQATKIALKKLLPTSTIDWSKLQVLEVGAGDSLVAEIAQERGLTLSCLTISDASSMMLAYSLKWEKKGAKLLIADARCLRLQEDSLDLLIASLGDPYNNSEFWQEVHRVLKPGGEVIFTTPGYKWASLFRSSLNSLNTAEFTIAGGALVQLPSLVYESSQQTHLIESACLKLVENFSVGLSQLKHPVSPKLHFDELNQNGVITAYRAIKKS